MARQSTWREGVLLYLKGWGMGIADLIPGISGGTMALIFGIYEELIGAIKSLNLVNLQLVFKGRWRQAAEEMSLGFLFVLLSGIGSAIIILSGGVKWVLHNHPDHLYGFFFGLILATIPLICRVVRCWSPGKAGLFIFFAAAAYKIVQLVPVQTPDTFLYIFGSGAIAICAMILPGISGSFILLILGKYQAVLEALHDRDIVFLAVFSFGMAVGVLSFVRLVSWVLAKAHDWMIAALAGFVAGSLYKIWPWKVTVEFILDRHGLQTPLIQKNILPVWSTQTAVTFLLIGLGFGLAATLGGFSRRSEP
jgi:putative membrane protein